MYETLILGQVSEDINIDFDGHTIRETGGAVIYSGHAASALGHKIAVLCKGNRSQEETEKLFEKAENVTVFTACSESNTSIKNQYLTEDKEKRICTAISLIEPYQISDLPDIHAEIIHIAGLMKGDIPDEIIGYASKKAKVALDVQGVLRCAENGAMINRDWKEKQQYLPLIDFLKTDAAEAELLTGTANREESIRILSAWGAKEVMITHNTEVMVYRDGKIYREPLKPRNLSGRSGRGDTCFSTYINERLTKSIEDSLLLAAATVSLKMEKPGPFLGTRQDVEAYIREFYG